MKLFLDIQRITPLAHQRFPHATPAPSATAATVVAPRALPVEPTRDTVEHCAGRRRTRADAIADRSRPTPATTASPTPTEPKSAGLSRCIRKIWLRRSVTDAERAANRVKSPRCGKPFVRVAVDRRTTPAFDGWIDPSRPAAIIRGRRFDVQVLERDAVQLHEERSGVAADDDDVNFDRHRAKSSRRRRSA